jgi:2-oxoglutarate ferredoxin oxidoreductase subunit alpha
MITTHYRVPKARLAPGLYRNISGNEAATLGFITASRLSGRPLFYGSYPITPASEILHNLAKYKRFGVRTFQAEDEISAIGSAIGAAYGGCLGLTGTSGPGLALKSEALGLAVMTELPIVVADIQRAGPSTGMPTKTEQADLLQALFGRNGECPVAIVAPATPSDCFFMAIEAFRIALRHMVPVIYMSDLYLGFGSEPWKIPSPNDLPKIDVHFADDPETFLPYRRDPDTLARPWAIPGTPGLEHRIGGIEKADGTGNVSYDPNNHEFMVRTRAEKIQRIAKFIPAQEVHGPAEGEVAVVGWGSTFGAIRSAVNRLQHEGAVVSHVHLRYLNPLPSDLGKILQGFRKVLVPEINLGQLLLILRARYLVDAIGLHKIQGRPFQIAEIETKVRELLQTRKEHHA